MVVPEQPWYERPAPVFALLLSAAVAAVLLLIGWYTVNYYRAFKSGQPTALPQFQDRFTVGRLAAAVQATGQFNLATDDAPTLGDKNAKVTIVVFGDFECPFTKEAHPTIRTIAAEFSDRVRVVWRDFPLETIHPRARAAALAASCAGQQGKYWQMHDKLFDHQQTLERKDFIADAEQIGLDTSAFAKCLDSGGDHERLARDIQAGTAAGLRGTPTFFINGSKIEGAIPYDILKQIVLKLSS